MTMIFVGFPLWGDLVTSEDQEWMDGWKTRNGWMDEKI